MRKFHLLIILLLSFIIGWGGAYFSGFTSSSFILTIENSSQEELRDIEFIWSSEKLGMEGNYRVKKIPPRSSYKIKIFSPDIGTPYRISYLLCGDGDKCRSVSKGDYSTTSRVDVSIN